MLNLARFLSITVVALSLMTAVTEAQSAMSTRRCTPFKVLDGDTFDARCGTSLEVIRIRLYQADAPERNQPWGAEAHAWLSTRVLGKEHRILVLAEEPGTKVYKQRLVANVYAPRKSVSVNAHSVREGMSWVSPGFAVKTDRIWKDYDAAKTAKLGVWSTKDPIPPWGWRHGQRHIKLVVDVPKALMHEPVEF